MNNLLNEKAKNKLGVRNEYLLNFLINDIKDKTVLDIGCGFGWLEYRLKKKIKKIIGIDINKKDITQAKKEIKSNMVTFLVGSGLKLPVRPNSIDVVVASEVIEHLQKNSETLFFKEINRVLKIRGKLFITTPFNDIRSKFFDPAWWLIGHRHYSLKSLKELSKKTNLHIVDYKIWGRGWSMLGLLNLYISKWIFHRKRFFEDFFYKKELSEMESNKGWMNLMVKYQK
jgi:ubiquinone/menaquinone biosynthesis C-methylase UbiE